MHCRCKTCAELQTLLIRACQQGVDRAVHETAAMKHYAEVRRWRSFEEFTFTQSRHDEGVVVLTFDDTSALGLPRFTKREIKNMTNVRIRVVPWNLTNHGAGENYYIYTVYEMYKKGGNRLCTTLYHYLRRLKYNTPPEGHGPNKQRTARKLILMADNYGENKNNIVFAFCAELVLRGWFDVVQFFFGPVGHTHNGNDSVHYTHNQIAGNQVSVTLAEFFTAYHASWKKPETRPQPAVLDVVYDWESYYDTHLQRIACFNKTRNSQTYVRGFQWAKTEAGIVEMRVKGSPSDKVWYGQGGNEHMPGFVVLRTLPRAPPHVVPPLPSSHRHLC